MVLCVLLIDFLLVVLFADPFHIYRISIKKYYLTIILFCLGQLETLLPQTKLLRLFIIFITIFQSKKLINSV